MSADEKARILAVYLRPWTLLATQATLHVPHLKDLDALWMPRLRGKQSFVPPPRSFAASWREYRTKHVVSEHAARIIKSFLLTQMLESAEADEEEEGAKTKEPLEPISTHWASIDTIHDLSLIHI